MQCESRNEEWNERTNRDFVLCVKKKRYSLTSYLLRFSQFLSAWSTRKDRSLGDRPHSTWRKVVPRPTSSQSPSCSERKMARPRIWCWLLAAPAALARRPRALPHRCFLLLLLGSFHLLREDRGPTPLKTSAESNPEGRGRMKEGNRPRYLSSESVSSSWTAWVALRQPSGLLQKVLCLSCLPFGHHYRQRRRKDFLVQTLASGYAGKWKRAFYKLSQFKRGIYWYKAIENIASCMRSWRWCQIGHFHLFTNLYFSSLHYPTWPCSVILGVCGAKQ